MSCYKALQKIVILVVATLLLNACGASTPVPGPTFEGRLLIQVVTHGDEKTRPGLYELTRNPASGETAFNLLVPDLPDLKATGYRLWDLVVSDNKAHLLYTTEKGILWRDLQTGAETTVFSQTSECVSAAPDARLLSFTIEDKLYIYHVATQTAESIFQSPSGNYGGGRSVAGFDCGAWIAPGRLVFPRRVGNLPSSVDIYKGIPADTITLALVDEEVTFVDRPAEFIYLTEVSPDGNYALMPCQDVGLCFFQTPSFDDFETPGNPLACFGEDGCLTLGFTLSGHEYMIERQSQDYQLILVNPDTLVERPGPKIPSGGHDWVWSRDSQNVVAFLGSPEPGVYSVVVISDLSTGGETILWEAGRSVYVSILAWLAE